MERLRPNSLDKVQGVPHVDRIAEIRGYLCMMVSDNSPE
ncbi:hypothetical protein SAMN05421539_102666 [Jannaschia seohaensis]|uniref:Uncharacterized protein n=1 Tax=Jannaschia seohaensis TaxID=475081 RepID=A0A2Y9AHL3_9RHOB|nr:hypothetical protein BCF38_102666 [Jannaschia seohaensis]SSA42019.1 hypothetical protein SAMN05421539_102666 [Jannaschia seohaensis]